MTLTLAERSGPIDVKDLGTVYRLGFGAMRVTGPGIWGEPKDRDEAQAVLRRAVELGVNFLEDRRVLRALCQRRDHSPRPCIPIPRA